MSVSRVLPDGAERVLGIVLLVFVAAVLLISLYFDSFLQVSPLSQDEWMDLTSGWSLSEGGNQLASSIDLPYKIPEDVKGKTFSFTTTLPDEFPYHHTSFSTETSMCSLEIFIGGTSIYSFQGDMTPWKNPVLGGGYSHFVRLPEDAFGRELKMEMTFYSGGPFAGYVRAPSIGSKGDQIVYQLRELPSLAFGFIFLFTGLVCVLTSLGIRKGQERNSVWYFGWLEIALGLWVFTQNCAKLIILRNSVLLLNFSYLALFILPYILIHYVNSSYTIVDRIFKPFVAISYLFLIGFITGGVLQFFGLFTYAEMVLHAGAALVIYILALFTALLIDFHRGNRELISFLAAVGVLLITVVAEEALLMMSIVLENATVLHLGMSLCGGILLIRSAKVVSQGNYSRIREQMLVDLAYTDSLTGVRNRTSYERRVKDIRSRGRLSRVIGVILVDINDLKPINDTRGHAVGDTVLKHAALTLAEHMPSESEIYRIGGDEFVVFIPSVTEERMHLLCNTVSSLEFASDVCTYTVACGSALYRRDRKESLIDVIAEADAAMYRRKGEMKKKKRNQDLAKA